MMENLEYSSSCPDIMQSRKSNSAEAWREYFMVMPSFLLVPVDEISARVSKTLSN
jgi:hypothetical protein